MSGVLDVINWFLDVTNKALDIALPWLLLAILLVYPALFFIRGMVRFRKESKEDARRTKLSETLSGTLILLFIATAIYFLFWLLPEIALSQWPRFFGLVMVFRWILFLAVVSAIAYYFGHKNGGKRWIFSTIGHLAVVFIGYLIQYWVGILIISLPILLIYYCALYDLATIILPASAPENRSEKWKKFLILVSYSWGFQRPMIAVEGHAWKKPETRIQGNIGIEIPVPGLIWLRSHQAAGITSGMKFKRVDGPGLIFTSKKEQPLQIMDLRPQIRTSEIDVVSQDGIGFKTRVVTKFRLDPEQWDEGTYNALRGMNPLLNGAEKPSYTQGSFPFSKKRIQAAIGITSSDITGEISEYWDRWALRVIEHETRLVISQKNLEELWRPKEDKVGANALETIAEEIQKNADLRLRSKGIKLMGARVVTFSFPSQEDQPDEITEQQILNWGSEWERKRANILAEARADAERFQQEARVYAQSILLNSIAEGLQKTEKMNPKLPPYVIAMRFLSSLQDLIPERAVDEETNSENANKMVELQRTLREWRNQVSPIGKEKLP
jgi:hypothetical protein